MKKPLIIVLFLVSVVLLGKGGWIYAKAELAQFLIADAWAQQHGGAGHSRPWPWADTWPVARLQVPELGVDQFVLEGASGRVLAFGPGHVSGTVFPGKAGNSVISGHRDTHFRWLKDLQSGDRILLEGFDGKRVSYRVRSARVVSEQDTWILGDQQETLLRLVTCYPFDAVMPGGAQRYVVTATSESSSVAF